MVISISDSGNNNTILLPDDIPKDYNLTIKICGDNNYLELCDAFSCAGSDIILNQNNKVVIGRQVKLEYFFLYADKSGKVTIGDGMSCNGRNRILLHEPGLVDIGCDCLLAGGIEISVSDMHPIFDKATGMRINYPRNVLIEQRVWLGQDCKIMKGVHIGADTVIGAGSVVTGVVPAQCIAAGNPARVKKTGIVWRHNLETVSLDK